MEDKDFDYECLLNRIKMLNSNGIAFVCGFISQALDARYFKEEFRQQERQAKIIQFQNK